MNIFFCGKRNKPRIALTFDDGPSEETVGLLEVLQQHKARATFFVLGNRILSNEYIIHKIVESGNEIGNHTYSHKPLWFRSFREIRRQINLCDKELLRAGIQTNLFRFPHFRCGPFSLFFVSYFLKKKVIFSDVISNDWKQPLLLKNKKISSRTDVQQIIDRVLKKTKNGSIVNLHDYLFGIGNHKEIISITEGVVSGLKQKGFSLVTISELLKN